jgi:hypothetical protein
MAEGYVEQIRSLRGQIDSLTGVSTLEEARTGVLIRLVGPAIGFGVTSASILGNTILGFRKSIRAIASSLEGQSSFGPGRISDELERSSDLVLLNVMSGSLQIALDLPSGRQLALIGGPPDPATSALELFMEAAAWASVDESYEDAVPSIEDIPYTRLVLSQVINMSPHERGPIQAVEFSGNLVHTNIPPRLTWASRVKARRAAADTEAGEYVEAVGVIREIDLDRRRFELRQRPNGEPDLPCIVVEDMIGEAKVALGERVRVAGTFSKQRRVKKILTVTSFEILSVET